MSMTIHLSWVDGDDSLDPSLEHNLNHLNHT